VIEPPAPKSRQRRVSMARAAVAGLGALAPPGATFAFHPMFAAVFVTIEVAVAPVVIFTALFGSETISERAFRLLRWVANRPEPAAPPQRRLLAAQSQTPTLPKSS